jgi:AcrR family transcriptional regulator
MARSEDEIGSPATSTIEERPQLSFRFVAEHQRRRVPGAVAQLARGSGAKQITVTDICRQAQIGRANFYRVFGGRSDCLDFAFRFAFERIFAATRDAAEESERPWLTRMDAGIGAFYGAVATDPDLAELCLIHAPVANGSTGSDREAGVRVMVDLMCGGRAAAAGGWGESYRERGPLVEEFLGRGIVSLAATRVLRGETSSLSDRRAEMVQLAATAFLGSEQAARACQCLGANRPS